MTHISTFLATAFAVVFSAAAYAQSITIEDPYARASTHNAKSGAAFMTIVNTAPTDDRLVTASSEVAARVELHTHLEDANGVMRMIEVEDGILVPAGGKAMLMRGADHVMFMGLKVPFVDGETVEVTLTFEQAGDITVAIPVDLQRKPMSHGAHGGQATN